MSTLTVPVTGGLTNTLPVIGALTLTLPVTAGLIITVPSRLRVCVAALDANTEFVVREVCDATLAICFISSLISIKSPSLTSDWKVDNVPLTTLELPITLTVPLESAVTIGA